MNSRERFFAAAQGREVDRVPVVMWHHYTGENEFGENNIRQHTVFAREAGTDLVKISLDGYFAYPLEFEIKTPQDWRRIKPLPRNHRYFMEQRERVRRINELLQEEYPTHYVVFMPFSYMRHSTSDAFVMAHLKEDPEAVMEGLRFFTDETLYNMRNVMEYGHCDGMLLSLQAAEIGRFSVDEYLDMIRIFDDVVLNQAATYSAFNFAHFCGWAGNKNQLDCWRNINPGINIINWATAIEEISMEEGKKRFAPRTIMGGFDNREGTLITEGSEQAIKEHVIKTLQTVGTKGVIIGADCSLPETIDHRRIRWVVEACEEYGNGPLTV